MFLFSLKHQLVHSEPHPCPLCHRKLPHGGQDATKEHPHLHPPLSILPLPPPPFPLHLDHYSVTSPSILRIRAGHFLPRLAQCSTCLRKMGGSPKPRGPQDTTIHATSSMTAWTGSTPLRRKGQESAWRKNHSSTSCIVTLIRHMLAYQNKRPSQQS